MKIEVHDRRHQFDEQTRAYAEYRVFSALAAHGDAVNGVDVELTRTEAYTAEHDATGPGDAFACRIAIRLRSGREFEATSRATHPYEAIERAARRITSGTRTMFEAVETTAAPIA